MNVGEPLLLSWEAKAFLKNLCPPKSRRHSRWQVYEQPSLCRYVYDLVSD